MKPLYTQEYCDKSVPEFITPFQSNNFISKIFMQLFVVVLLCGISMNGYMQMVGPSCYTQGTSVEFAIDGAGGYEGVQTGISPTPGGYHFRSNNPIFGFVSNPQVNTWATFDGDFFTPGTPENGWGIEIIDGATDLTASNNCAGPIQIAGAITGYVVNGLCRIITWEGNYTSGPYSLHLKIDYVLMVPDLYYTTVVTVTNNGITIPDFYYYRNFDPDNNVFLSGDYSTTNTIVSQPGAGCNKAHVRATSIVPAGQPQSYVGLAGVGANWRADYGGFSNRDASDLWNGVGFVQASGSSLYADQAIALAYRISNLTAGSTQQFRFVVILDDLAANNAVNNLFTFTWPGAPVSTSTQCNPVVDTVTICNGNSATISVQGSALADFTWNWTPVAGLTPSTGVTVVANPVVNTLYTVTGTPVNPCFNPVTQQIYVRVVAGSTLANGGPDQVLTCTSTTATLFGTSGSPSPTFSWAGPGLVSSVTNPTAIVNQPGTYILTVTSGGCSISDTVIVTQNITPPNANAGVDQTLTCIAATVNLAGSSSTGGVTCVWAGPGIVSGGTTFTPTVNAVGNYTVTVTNPVNGCTSTDVVAVTLNNTPPNANAGIDMALTCAITSINLAGSSATGGATAIWAGPGIVSGGSTFTPTVNLAGSYTITVTNPANGCTSTDVAVVTGSVLTPNANAGIDMTLTCTTPSLILGGSSSTPGATFVWAGPGVVSGGATATPTVNAAGTYTVTVTNPANGCTATDIVVVNLNNTPPNANAGLDATLTCIITSLNLSGSSATGGATCNWTGPGVTAGATTWTPTINAAGTYTVTVTNPTNGCTSTDIAVVTLDNIPPNANAGLDATLTCVVTSLNLSGSSATGGATCNWTGPGVTAGATTWTPTINAAGTYTVTVTNPANGCTATDMAVVNLNNTLPNANAGADMILTCVVPTLNLAGSSSTGGATVVWSGPSITAGGTTFTPTVNGIGTYTITVTDPTNGCTSTDQVVVTMNGVLPNANAGLDQTLNCTVLALNLNGSSATPGVNFAWTGPSITAGAATATPTVNGPGTYTVTVTDPTNGCTSTDQVVVNLNNTIPNANAGADQILNCVVLNVNMNGSSSTPGVSFAWTGPSISAGAATSTPTVNGPGTYTVTITDPTNGCTNTDQAIVNLNNTIPNASAGLDEILNCTITSVNLGGSSSTPGVTFSWAGPFITGGATTTTPSVNGPGNYVITVTDPSNGCTNTDLAVVTQNIVAPNANAGPDGILNCVIPNINLAGSSSTGGATPVWSGPSITAGGTTYTPTVDAAGTYTVTVTDPTNGCTSTDLVNVTLNATIPDVNAGPDQILNCNVIALNMAGSSATAGVSFAWVGPGVTAGGTTSTPTINMPGAYVVTVTDPTNGCTNTDVADVAQNITPPGANAGLDDILNCVILSVNLNGSATTPGATFVWAGPSISAGGATNTPTVNGPGTYTVTTTDPVNGCTSTDVVDVVLNNTPPNISMGSNQNILCNTPIVILSGASSTPGATFSWVGASIVGSSTNANVNADIAGTYTLTVTDPSNGCTSTGTVDAILTLNYPTADFYADNLSGCAPLCATLSDNSTISGSPLVGWHWAVESQGTADVPGGTFCFNDPGTYDVTLTVTTSDGCTSTLFIPNYLTVYANPIADFMHSPIKITEFDPLVIFGNTSVGGDTYLWDFGDGGTSSSFNPTHMYGDTGTYCVTLLTTTINGCIDTTEHCLIVIPEFNVFIPNSFTVNEDGLNEIWSVVGRGVKTFEARIFDRWGEELYFFNDIDKGWNGTRQNGNLCPQGVYVYRILITDYENDFHEYIGNVNLIR